jgi:hypothetical protein
VQTFMKHQIVSGLKGSKLPGWKMVDAARYALVAMAAVCGLGFFTQAADAQVPAVVASSQINLTPSGGLESGMSVVDSCGDVYLNESGGPVVEIQAGTGVQTILSANTNGYNNGTGIAIDSTKSNLYFPTDNQWYSSQFSTVPITNCTPGGISTFAASALGGTASLFSYYYGTASNIAVDGYGDVFFTVTADGTGDIGEIPCSTAPATACTVPPTGTAVLALSGFSDAITSLAADSTGNLYFTDGGANVYELKAPYTGTPVTIGSNFVDPVGLSFDPQGNLYVADANGYALASSSNNYTIQNPTASILYEIPSEAGALNTADQFEVVNNIGLSNEVAVDASQHIYITNGTDDLLEEVIGGVTLPATDLGSSSASTPINYVFNTSVTPAAINLVTGTATSTLFANAGNGCAAGTAYTAGQSCSVNLTYTPSAGGLQTGAVILANASGTAINTAAVSAIGDAVVVTVDPGTVTPFTGAFKTPEGAAIDSQGNIYVADAGNNTITEFVSGSTTGTVIATGTLTLSGPSAVAVDDIGDIFISDTGNNRIVEVQVVNGVLTPASATALSITVTSPAGLAFDGLGNFYIANAGSNQLLYVPNYNGALNTSAVQAYGSGFSGPLAVAVDLNRNVYVADTGNNAVEELPGPIGSQAQVKVLTGLNDPTALTTDASGSLYVVNAGSESIEKYPSLSGSLGAGQLVGGTIAAPYGVTIDSNGNLYATDNVNAVVDEIARVQTTLPFGSWNVSSTSTPLTATVSDAGNLQLTFPSPSYSTSGSTMAGYSVTSDGCGSAGTVAPGGSCDITATFTPPAIELNAEETLTLLGNGQNGTSTIGLLGTGANISPSTLTLALTSPAAGSTLTSGESVTFTATVGTGSNTASPGGSVTFNVNGTQAGTSTVTNDVATITLPNGLPGGTVVISATYGGDEINYSGSSASITEMVVALPDTLTLVVDSPYTNPSSANDNSANATGPSVPLVATLVPSSSVIPSGTVSFYSGTAASSTLLGTAPIVGGSGGTFTATLNENSLRAGTTNVVENNSTLTTYSVFAVYSGNASYGPSTSNTAALTVVAPPVTPPACATASPATCDSNTTGATFSITPASPSLTVTSSASGQGSGSVVLTINSYGGWVGVLNFTCTNLPAYATCAPYPGDPTLGVASTAATTVAPTTVQFIINTNVQPLPPTASGFYWWLSGICGLVLLLTRRRLKRFGMGGVGTALALALLMVASLGGAVGCGSATPHDLTPAGTSNVMVTVSAAQLVPSTTDQAVELPDSNVGSFTIALTVQ